eukprot:scaffold6111_cov107-Isochrysis_galbana.AAC.1
MWLALALGACPVPPAYTPPPPISLVRTRGRHHEEPGVSLRTPPSSFPQEKERVVATQLEACRHSKAEAEANIAMLQVLRGCGVALPSPRRAGPRLSWSCDRATAPPPFPWAPARVEALRNEFHQRLSPCPRTCEDRVNAALPTHAHPCFSCAPVKIV